MTDREMLEYAAKAAGIAHVTPTMVKWGHWKPRDDDGDSFRLMVALKIDVKHYDDYVVVSFDDGYIGTGRIFYEGDPLAATRYAIFRAAAEIGKGIP